MYYSEFTHRDAGINQGYISICNLYHLVVFYDTIWWENLAGYLIWRFGLVKNHQIKFRQY